MRILIADDDLGTRLICKQVLEKARHEVIAADSGESAWQTLEKTKVDLILCDLNMPGLNGMELIERFPKDPRTKDMRVIVFTADATRKTVQQAASHRVAGYLLKPLVAGELLAKVGAQSGHIPVVLEDWTKVQKRLGVEMHEYRSMLKEMVEGAKKSLQEMKQKLVTGPVEEVVIYFNGLKSGAISMGAMSLARGAVVAERGIGASAPDVNLKFLLNVEAELERLEILIRKEDKPQ